MNERKTIIFFRALGNAIYGMGHVYRSLSLAKFISTNKPAYLPVFIIRQEEQSLQKLIIERGFTTQHLETMDVPKKSLLVYDMPCLEADMLNKKPLFSSILGLDYFYNISIDRSLNLFTHQPDIASAEKVKAGIEFALLNENILTSNKALNVANTQIQQVLITFGSLDPQNNTLKALRKLQYFSGKIEIILGPLYAYKSTIVEYLQRCPTLQVSLFESPQGIGSYIQRADLVFCGGGTTLLESIYLAKAAIILAQTPAELSFAKHLAEQGLCYIEAQQLLSFTQRENLRKKCLQTSIGNGAQLIMNNIEELLSAQ